MVILEEFEIRIILIARITGRRLTTVNRVEACDLSEGMAVTERNENNAVVGEGRHGIHDGSFLASTGGTGRDEDTSVFSSKLSLHPERTSSIPKGLSESEIRYQQLNCRGQEHVHTFHWAGMLP